MKKKQVNLQPKLVLDKMVVASLVNEPEKIVGGAIISRPNTLCLTINYTVCNTVCGNQICA
ncbi:hypothetical protein ACTJJB_13190 [Chitinophaga sp. 22536]|uniref:hypothetical protein n=1 Tax=unclassified Chitinophaga TaxID=2619133 RepID=UPI003F842AD3